MSLIKGKEISTHTDRNDGRLKVNNVSGGKMFRWRMSKVRWSQETHLEYPEQKLRVSVLTADRRVETRVRSVAFRPEVPWCAPPK